MTTIIKRSLALFTLVSMGAFIPHGSAEADVVLTPSSGFSLTWNGNDGDFFGVGASAPAPANLASATGASAFASGSLGGTHFSPELVRNGSYGNVSSWISDATTPAYVGINLNGTFDLNSLAWGRDNGNTTADSGGNPQFMDRNLGTYTVQITNDLTPSTATTNWTTVGTLNYVSSDDAVVGGGFTGYFRHEYGIGKAGGPLLATGVRLIVPAGGIGAGTAIDEFEIYGSSPIPTSDLRAWTRGDGDVQTSGANVVQWNDHSGNGNFADQTVPGNRPDLVAGAINDLPAVRFDAGFEHLNMQSGIDIHDSDYEIFVVAKSGSSAIQFLTAGEGGGGVGNFELHLNGGTGARFIPSSAATTDGTHLDTFADIGVAGQFTDGRAHIFNQRVEGNLGILRVVGMENGDTVLNAQSSFANRLTLGVRGNASLPFRGDMGEVLVYNRALSATERRQVERYLAQKWDAPLNVASQTQGGIAFANEVIAGGTNGFHQVDHLNDALYGNPNSWIGNDNGGSSAFAGVGFDDRYTISSLAFGRDATGGIADRTGGTYTFQYTTDSFDPMSITSVNGAAWIDFLELTLADGPDALRTIHDFDPIFGARGVRVLVNNNIAIDELEVYGLLAVPEPSAYALALFGLVGLVGLGIRQRKLRK